MNRCRLCLAYREATVSIDQDPFREKLKVVFQLQFDANDKLPTAVCTECCEKVDNFYDYTQQVCKAQEQLSSEEEEKNFDFVEIKAEHRLEDEPIIETDQLSPKVIASMESAQEVDHLEEQEMVEALDTEPEENDDSLDDDVAEGLEIEVVFSDRDEGNTEKELLKETSTQLMEENNRIKEFFSMTCELCSVELDTFYQLQKHFRKAHNERGFIRCCNEKFYRRFKLLDHISFHVTPDAYRCELCQRSYKNRYTLQQHLHRRHSGPKHRPYKCDKCHQSYEKSYQLRAHAKRHILAPCQLCDKVMSSNQALRAHIDNIHRADKKLICDTCGEQFRTKPALDRHVRKHLGLELVEKRQCPQCGVWVNGARGLKMHTRNVHPGKDEVFECDICHQRCKNATTLYQHRKGVHASDQYECEFCGKRFKRKIYLKEHRASHVGQSLYSCDVCGLKMNSNGNMYAHKKSQHPEEWREAQRRKQEAAAEEARKSIAALAAQKALGALSTERI
ncbi:transcription factor grauzone-like [Anopheles cruzii]|uniref:transcription factor grauzone-like n=1 Tax=Anopheles cruzii TaxID=68878 RepID=UPI0022EC184D|nr:transcription factor grauzone-like [Anopheles cruzii]